MLISKIVFFLISIFITWTLIGYRVESDFFKLTIFSLFIYAGINVYILLKEKYRLLSVILVITFLISFSVIFEYLFFNDVILLNSRIGIQQFNGNYEKLVYLTLIFSIGFLALILGLSSGKKYRINENLFTKSFKQDKVFSVTIYIFICLLILVLKYMISPKNFVMNVGYTELRTTGLDNQIAGLGSLHYFLSLMFLPLYLDFRNAAKKNKLKAWLFYITLIIYLVVFEFLKGERTSIGILVCFIVLRLYFSENWIKDFSKKIRKISMITFFSFIFLFLLGFVREEGSINERIEKFTYSLGFVHKTGTWMGATYSTIGANNDFLEGKELLFGETYKLYFESLIPQILLTPFDVKKALNDEKNDPGYWYFDTYTQGGLSLLVVPLRNFGVLGVFFVMFFLGKFIKALEISFFKSNKVFVFIIYCSVLSLLLRWVWYGEIYLIRAIMMGYFVFLSNKVILKFS